MKNCVNTNSSSRSSSTKIDGTTTTTTTKSGSETTCSTPELKWPGVPLEPMVPVPGPPNHIVGIGLLSILLTYIIFQNCLIPAPSLSSQTATSSSSSSSSSTSIDGEYQHPYHSIMILICALISDRFLGGIPLMIHPVVLVGRFITFFQRNILPSRYKYYNDQPILGFIYGIGVLVSTVTVAVASAWSGMVLLNFLVESVTNPILQSMLRLIAFALELLIMKSTISLQLLCRVALQMGYYLERNQIQQGRKQLCWLCSRDASELQMDELAGGTIESVAENLGDSFVGPLFWYAVFAFLGPTAGTEYSILPSTMMVCIPPPVIGALFFRTVNTLDSRIGHRGKYEYYGKASARFDDLLCIVPARLTALFLALGVMIVKDGSYRHAVNGMRVGWYDSYQCDSVNAGWPMGVMAGALHVKLEKRGQYCLGGGGGAGGKDKKGVPLPPSASDIRRSVVIARAAGTICAASISILCYLLLYL